MSAVFDKRNSFCANYFDAHQWCRVLREVVSVQMSMRDLHSSEVVFDINEKKVSDEMTQRKMCRGVSP